MIDLDELGPLAARSSPGPGWSDATHRPHFRPDSARYGYRWAFGALAHRTGTVYLETSARRDTAAWLHFLEGLEAFTPPGDAYLIVDNLALHWSVDTMLWNWGHPRFHFVPLPIRAIAQSCCLAEPHRGLLEDPGAAGARRSRLHQHRGGR